MGLRASIYRNPHGDFSNGGISGRFIEVTIVNVEGPFEPTEDAPGVRLESGPMNTVRAVPEDGGGPDMVGPMMGGAYVATSDSRFGDKVRALLGTSFYGAVALHDRWETTRQYASYD